MTAHAVQTAERALQRAELALSEQKGLAETVGALGRDVRASAGRVDDLISTTRKLRASQHLLTEEVKKVLLLLVPMRAKLGSVSGLEEGLDELQKKELRRERRRLVLGRWAKTLGRAALVGGATCAGAALFGYLLEAIFGIHLPHLEIHP